MKLLLLALLSLAAFNLSLAQDEVEPIEPFQDLISPDFLIRLQLNISEARIPNYLIDVIYNHPLEKNISPQAVLSLYRANTIDLATAQNILQLLNISQSRVFSINGLNYTLETFNWTFTNFYNTITTRLNLTGVNLRDGLIALQIDVSRFSEGITWGEPDPWQEFIKGNFSQANVELACSRAGITLEDLWTGTRDMFVGSIVSYQIKNFVQLLLDHTIDQPRALIVWNAIPITLDHVYSLALYNEIISNFTSKINSQVALGVLTSLEEAVIHRSNYDVFREEQEFLDIRIQTLLTRTLLTARSLNATTYRNLVVVAHQSSSFNNLTAIGIANHNSNLNNCSYVTFLNNDIVTVNVPEARFVDKTYAIPSSLVQNVVAGSALVCNNTVYGLVRGIVGESIIADAFSNYVGPPLPGLAYKTVANSAMGMVVLATLQLFI